MKTAIYAVKNMLAVVAIFGYVIGMVQVLEIVLK